MSDGGKGETAARYINGQVIFVDDQVRNLLDVQQFFPKAILVLACETGRLETRAVQCLGNGDVIRLCKWRWFLAKALYRAKVDVEGCKFRDSKGSTFFTLTQNEYFFANYIGRTEWYEGCSWTALIIKGDIGWVPSNSISIVAW